MKPLGMHKIDQFDWWPGLNETTATKPGDLGDNITLSCLYKSRNITLIITQPPKSSKPGNLGDNITRHVYINLEISL